MAAKHPLEVYRDQHGLTQDSLGKLIGVEAATISRWEQRKRAPRGNDLQKICTLTGISAAEIIGIAEAAE
jgi:transcriptional regulator with XRE-family HTH domain